MKHFKRIVAIWLAVGMVGSFTSTSTGDAHEATAWTWTGSGCIPDSCGPACCT